MHYVTTKEFANILEVSQRSVQNWIKKGMPCEGEGKKAKIDVLSGLKWQLNNIPVSSPFKPTIKDTTDYDNFEDLTVEDQLRVKRMEKLELEMSITRGEYIPIDEVDETTAQLSALLINQYRQHMRILPKILAKKSETQIKKALDEEFEKSIKTLQETYEKEDTDEDRK